jgi:hypothetical protein
LFIVIFNKSADTGLVKNSLHPLSMAAILSFSYAYALTAMTGTLADISRMALFSGI